MNKHVPILFSTKMVKAILNGTKTQTRRIVTQRNSLIDGYPWGNHECDFEKMDWNDVVVDGGPGSFAAERYLKVAYPANQTRHRIYPKIEVGNIFWVRETFAEGLSNKDAYAYRASSKWSDFEDVAPTSFEKIKWKPSIFMPKDVCRLFLEVTNVRVERLHDISEDDAMDEGINKVTKDGSLMKYCVYDKSDYSSVPWQDMPYTAKECFFTLWESINGKESLESNPWVWVYDFKSIDKIQ